MKKAFKFIPVSVISIISASFLIAQTSLLPRFRKHESYRTVRIKMLKAGWKPFHAADADPCGDGDTRCAGRPEMTTCSGTGMAFCVFTWKRGRKTATIQTSGDDASLDSVSVQ
jgi:hypothetical protein